MGPPELQREMKMTKTCDTLRNLIALSDAEIEARFEEAGYGVTIGCLTFTEFTIAELKAAQDNWNEPGYVYDEEDDYIVIERAQPMRGQPRRDVMIVDFGTIRAVYGALK